MVQAVRGKKVNLGLNLLRVWLSFEVVADHFWHEEDLTGVAAFLFAMRSLAVPCFLLMTFFLTANRYETSDVKWLKTRFVRLGIPYFVWPVIYFAAILLCSSLSSSFVQSTVQTTELKAYGFDLDIGLKDLLWQWSTGIDRRLLHQFWFHSNLIFWTAGMFALLKLVKGACARTCLLGACVMVGLVMQYSGWNEFLFGRFDFELKYSLGRIFAVLPFAAVALLVASLRKEIDGVCGGLRAFLMAVGAFLLFFVHYSNCCPRPHGLGYQGISLLLMSFGTVMFFYLMPLANVPSWFGRIVELVSRYCMGIYCCHLLIGWMMLAWVFPHFGVKFEGFWGNVWIWAASWLVCWGIARIPGRIPKDLVQ